MEKNFMNEYKFSCPRCREEEVSVMIHATFRIPYSMFGKFTKFNISRKEVSLEGVDWERARIFCLRCGWNPNLHGWEDIIELVPEKVRGGEEKE